MYGFPKEENYYNRNRYGYIHSFIHKIIHKRTLDSYLIFDREQQQYRKHNQITQKFHETLKLFEHAKTISY